MRSSAQEAQAAAAKEAAIPLLGEEGWTCRQEILPKASLERRGRGGQSRSTFE